MYMYKEFKGMEDSMTEEEAERMMKEGLPTSDENDFIPEDVFSEDEEDEEFQDEDEEEDD